MKDKLERSLQKLEKWIDDNEYKGYEPFDGLSSPLSRITLGNSFAGRVFQQAVLRCPLNVRPLLGIKPLESTKGMGYMARGYFLMSSVTGNEEYSSKAEKCLDWLLENRSKGYSNVCWGNHYDFASRAFRLPRDEPIIVWTSLIGQAFIDAYEKTGDNYYLKIIRSICNFILEDLPREKSWAGSCISYVPFTNISIHNSNMLGAAMLARASKYIKSDHALEIARNAMEYSCCCQLPDGGWWYGEEKKYHWIDNFHTGYNLDSLKCYSMYSGDKDYEDHMRWGFSYYKSVFFDKHGRPAYYNNSLWPVDIQCAAQAIDTLANFSSMDSESLDLAGKVAEWTIDNMQDETGYFYYRMLPIMKVKIPMFHWGQTTMYHALAHLLSKLVETSGDAAGRTEK